MGTIAKTSLLKLWLILALTLPLTVTAETFNLHLYWNPYDWPTALIRGECNVNAGPFIEVGTATASTLQMPITVVAAKGDLLACRARGELNGEVSAWTTEATYRIPLGLTAPAGVRVAP